MYVEDSEPLLTFEGDGAYPQVYLGFKVALECPSCGQRHTGETRKNTLDPRWFDDAVKEAVNAVAERMDCANCGITSTLPRAEYEELLKKTLRKITPKFVREQISQRPKAVA